VEDEVIDIGHMLGTCLTRSVVCLRQSNVAPQDQVTGNNMVMVQMFSSYPESVG